MVTEKIFQTLENDETFQKDALYKELWQGHERIVVRRKNREAIILVFPELAEQNATIISDVKNVAEKYFAKWGLNGN